MRTVLLTLLLIPVAAGASRADLVTLGVPGEFTPGTAFTVDVGLTPVSNLGLYNVEVVFAWTGPGTLTVDPPAAAGGGYVFATDANFLAATATSAGELRLTLSDFTLDPTGPDVLAGVNDRLTTLAVRPSAALTTPIRIGIDRPSLFIDDAGGSSLLTGGPLPSATVNSVPSPAGGLLAGIAMISVAGWRRVRTWARR